MPDRAQLAEREQLEALRRSSRAPGVDAAVPVADEAALVREAALAPPIAGGQGVTRAGIAGMPRGMSPAMLMSMQRFAGNRATVQAVGLFQRSGSAGTKKPEEEKEPLEEDVSPGPEAKPPKETSAAAGPPDGGGPPGGSAPPPGAGATGGATGGGSGGAGSPGGPGDSGSGKSGIEKSGSEPTVKPPELEPGTAGTAGSGTEPTTKSSPVGGTIGGGAGAAIGAGESKSGKEPPPKPSGAAGAKPTGGGPKPGGGDHVLPPAGAPKPGEAPKPVETAGDHVVPPAGGGAKPGGGDHVVPPAGGPKPGGGDHVVPPGPTGPPPPPSAPLGPHGLPDPETAKSGIDWNQILSDYGPPVRTVLEVGRLIPGWGLLAGFGADALNFQSDLASIPKSENADLATGLIVFRNFVNIGNNAVGHILYVDQLIQDGLAGSVVGAEFTPLTAAANEVLSGVKVGLDEVQMGTDIVIEVEALYESGHAPTSAEAEQWKQLADGYAANLLGDVVNITLDIISLASAGAANTAPVQQARQPLSLAGAFMKSAVPNIIGGLNGVIGVWLGNLMTAGRHAFEGSPTELREKALIYDMAGGFVESEAGQARMTYTAVDAVIGAFEAYADQQIEQLDAITGALSGGKTAFQLIRDAVQSGLEDMQSKLSMVEQLGALASNAETNAAAISGACDTILGALDSLVIPSYSLPQVELGDSVVADAAEYLANQATAAANELIRRAVANIQSRIDRIKDEVRSPVEAVQQKADNLGEWLALLATESAAMAGTLNDYIAKFSDGLGKCTNAEQVMDLIIGEVSDLTGMPKFTVQEMRDGWHSIGTYIDGYVALGQALRQRATDLRQHADDREAGIDAGPDFAPPPPVLPPGVGTGAGPGSPGGEAPPAQPETAVA